MSRKWRQKKQPQRSPLVLLLLIVLWSVALGWGMALAIDPLGDVSNPKSKIALHSSDDSLNLKSVDPVPSNLQIGQELYLENCSSCHIPIPPAVLPTETWRKLLQEPQQHYGKKLPPLVRISQLLIWEYVKTFSRTLDQDEPMPIYMEQSRYFKALHPQVELPNPLTHRSCIICHPGAKKFDYRSLTPEWEN